MILFQMVGWKKKSFSSIKTRLNIVSIILYCYKKQDNYGRYSRQRCVGTQRRLTEKELAITKQITSKVSESIDLLMNFAKF